MSRIEMDRNVTDKRASGWIAFAANLLLPAIGIVCVLASHTVTAFLPYLLGGAMLVVGAADLATDVLRPKEGPGRITVGSDVVMLVLGVVVLANAAESLTVIAVVWGLLGVEKAAREIDGLLALRAEGGRWAPLLVSAAFELVLGTLLLVAPAANLGHHVLLLGIELATYPFHVVER